jgi:hypothetical protein
MSSSDFTCRSCRAVLGQVKPSGVLHPDREAASLIFVDNRSRTATFRCHRCGATINFRDGRIQLEVERKTA